MVCLSVGERRHIAVMARMYAVYSGMISSIVLLLNCVTCSDKRVL
jgi:hypothetical protein